MSDTNTIEQSPEQVAHAIADAVICTISTRINRQDTAVVPLDELDMVSRLDVYRIVLRHIRPLLSRKGPTT